MRRPTDRMQTASKTWWRSIFRDTNSKSIHWLDWFMNMVQKLFLILLKLTGMLFCSLLCKGIVGNELDANALTSRKSRTQVFSGRKLNAFGKGQSSWLPLDSNLSLWTYIWNYWFMWLMEKIPVGNYPFNLETIPTITPVSTI